MDPIKAHYHCPTNYEDLMRIYSIFLYHSRNTSYMMRRMKPVYYLDHTLSMEILFSKYEFGRYRKC